METTQSAYSQHDNERREAISELIEAVAEQQEALAKILEAEHKKIEKTTEMCDTDVDDLVRIDRSVERVIAAVTRLELALQLKLDLFSDCLCPRERNPGDYYTPAVKEPTQSRGKSPQFAKCLHWE